MSITVLLRHMRKCRSRCAWRSQIVCEYRVRYQWPNDEMWKLHARWTRSRYSLSENGRTKMVMLR